MTPRVSGPNRTSARFWAIGFLGLGWIAGCGSDDSGPITKETQPAPILNTTDDSLKNFYGTGDEEFIDGAKKTKKAR